MGTERKSSMNIAEQVKELTGKIEAEEKKQKDLFSQIGQVFYQKYADSAEGELRELCGGVQTSQAQVLQYQQKIEELTKITNCPACGTEVVDGAVFCHKCGANLREWKAPTPTPPPAKVCKYCGASLEEGAGFCVNCGRPIHENKTPKKKICPVCRCEAEPNQMFCSECGEELRN